MDPSLHAIRNGADAGLVGELARRAGPLDGDGVASSDLQRRRRWAGARAFACHLSIVGQQMRWLRSARHVRVVTEVLRQEVCRRRGLVHDADGGVRVSLVALPIDLLRMFSAIMSKRSPTPRTFGATLLSVPAETLSIWPCARAKAARTRERKMERCMIVVVVVECGRLRKDGERALSDEAKVG